MERTVIVADSTAPVIFLTGEAVVELLVGDEYIEQGATASDVPDGDLSDEIIIAGDVVDINVAGTYIVTYNVTDSDGEMAAEVIRTVIIKEEKEEDDDNKKDDDKNSKNSNKKTLGKPKNVSAKCYDGYVKIKWEDTSSGEDGYKIRRRVKGLKEWTKVTATNHEKKYSYKDKEYLRGGVIYEWKIRAYRKNKRGKWSSKVSCTVPVKKVVRKIQPRVEVLGESEVIEEVEEKMEEKQMVKKEAVIEKTDSWWSKVRDIVTGLVK